MLISPWLKEMLELALKEDTGTGDITTELLIPPQKNAEAGIIAREEGVIAGLDIAGAVFKLVDNRLNFMQKISDGEKVEKGSVIAVLSGSARSILTGERTALNFLQRLSGIATLTAEWVELIAGYPAQLVDTRKTSPGLRRLEKYAVMTGGGRNHRMNLSDGVLIKENHIKAAGGIRKAVLRAKEAAPVTLKTEVEVTCPEEFKEAMEAGADLIMLDNMDTETMKKAVELNRGRVLLEASGNITRGRLQEVAATGVDFISSGALTHSARALDLSLLIR